MPQSRPKKYYQDKGRSSGDDKSRQNPSFLSSVAGYSRNVAKEYKEWRAAQPKSKDGKAMPEAGQFYGAILQGRRYTKKGKQIK